MDPDPDLPMEGLNLGTNVEPPVHPRMEGDEEIEQQSDEMLALTCIYEGDKDFKQVDDITYQYKFTKDQKTFLLEIEWVPRYPNEKPIVNLEIFYNEHLLPVVKEKILAMVDKEVERAMGAAMTFTIFEYVRDKFDEMMADQIVYVRPPKEPKVPTPSTSQQPSTSRAQAKPADNTQKRKKKKRRN